MLARCSRQARARGSGGPVLYIAGVDRTSRPSLHITVRQPAAGAIEDAGFTGTSSVDVG
jgi:hypothetical protein